ncbi:DUF695 domain-containing protein [Solimonas sp. K1W22B-7]|uniref:DUF695 domain-containing protein n=1 Tax=Solimonas sp. K1W22B-7 TaxID=2303331 RepID=UPI000E337393|nr:DUF695 domain-containing protein [Solimonas sp. K1W22B-7]AXQ29105.1 DUF695 domain-containing protein [Solimonas sp. K1W22B-7]
MNEDWDWYVSELEGRPAATCLDLSLGAETPLPQLPHLVWLRLELQQPGSDGLPGEEEEEALLALEEELATLDDEDTRYVGRRDSEGARDFFFYDAMPDDWPERCARVMAGFAGYRHETGMREDRDWSLYRDVLYPRGEDFERMQNRRACEALQDNGDDLATPREIDHWIYFGDGAACAAFERRADELGFSVRARVAPHDEEPRHCLQLYRIDIPAPERIDEVTLPLYRAVREAGGDYDGWESQVVE